MRKETSGGTYTVPKKSGRYSVGAFLGFCHRRPVCADPPVKLVVWLARLLTVQESYQPAWGQYSLHTYIKSATRPRLEPATAPLVLAKLNSHCYSIGIVWPNSQRVYKSRLGRCVNILGLNVDANPLLGRGFMATSHVYPDCPCSPDSRVTALSYQHRLVLSPKNMNIVVYCKWT